MTAPVLTSPMARFRCFAIGHFILSLSTVALSFLGLPLLFHLSELGFLDGPPRWLGALSLLPMLAYFPIGAFFQRKFTPLRTGPDWAASLLLPALIAGIWAALVLFCLASEVRDVQEFLIPLFFTSLLLATPSSLLVLFALADAPDPMGSSGLSLVWIAVAGLAAVLPPLLYTLGSLWQSWRIQRQPPTPPEGENTNDTTP